MTHGLQEVVGERSFDARDKSKRNIIAGQVKLINERVQVGLDQTRVARNEIVTAHVAV